MPALVAAGLSDHEVAERPFHPYTVKDYLCSTYGRLGVANRAARLAAERGLG